MLLVLDEGFQSDVSVVHGDRTGRNNPSIDEKYMYSPMKLVVDPACPQSGERDSLRLEERLVGASLFQRIPGRRLVLGELQTAAGPPVGKAGA